MAGENLLHQRGSGTRQPDDEDRRLIGSAAAAVGVDELPVEAGDDAAASGFEGVAIEARPRVAQSIAGRIVFEGRRIGPALFTRPAEREMQQRGIVLVARRPTE